MMGIFQKWELKRDYEESPVGLREIVFFEARPVEPLECPKKWPVSMDDWRDAQKAAHKEGRTLDELYCYIVKCGAIRYFPLDDMSQVSVQWYVVTKTEQSFQCETVERFVTEEYAAACGKEPE